IGINVQNLAEVMGILDTQVATVFKTLNQEDRTTALELTMARLKGVAQDAGKGVAGQWQNVSTELALYFSDIIKNAEPLIAKLEQGIAASVKWAREGSDFPSDHKPTVALPVSTSAENRIANQAGDVAVPMYNSAQDDLRRKAQQALWESK